MNLQEARREAGVELTDFDLSDTLLLKFETDIQYFDLLWL